MKFLESDRLWLDEAANNTGRSFTGSAKVSINSESALFHLFYIILHTTLSALHNSDD